MDIIMRKRKVEKMKKCLIIAGISRGGKTTTCYEIMKKMNYQYMQMDIIVRAFQDNFPETGITHADLFFNVSKKLAPFLNTCVESFEKGNLLMDVYQLTPEDYVKYINRDVCDVCFIGYPDISVEEKFCEMRKYEQREEDNQKTDEELKQKCQKLVGQSKYLKTECEKWNVPFLNTSFDREKVIENYVSFLLNKE